jgi:hypothetical protein
VRIARGEVRRVRSPESEWNAKPLRAADRHVSAELSRRASAASG